MNGSLKDVEIYVQNTKPAAKIDKGDKAVESSRNDSANEVAGNSDAWEIIKNTSGIGTSGFEKQGATTKGKELALYNPFDLLQEFEENHLASDIVSDEEHNSGPKQAARLELSNDSWNVRGLNGVAHQRSVVQLVDNQYIHCKVTNKKEHTKCLITVLYGEYDLIPRRSLWRCIEQLASDICDDPWLITGDFNAVIDDSEDTSKHHIVGTAMYTLTRKLKALKPVLRGLRKRQGDLTHNVYMAEKFLSAAQTLNQKYQHDNVLIQSEAELLISPIQRQEIKDALFDIDEDSASGPDGFSSRFFKSAWAVIKDYFCSAVHEFFYHSGMLKQLNTTLLVLVPKVNMPVKVGDFRPIACCNVIYKVISKIMVKRMQLVLDKLIDSTQNAFVPGRSISTNVLLAQELLSGYNQKKLPPDA
ncbi:hypothetical protein Sango_2864700 [Sesamum angolense]|uniref:Reverse transcriptase domain-containing protein n=1 Tax=Sesamum angolense TaxID=2727404 RepID=A0AAE1T6L1_9LAMI|nr:hypothetical protein Sango_2864700 [Sesamum angolense]